MRLEQAISQLAATEPAITALVADMHAEQAAWRPAPDQWSALEVICHLLDEEREDFRLRLDLTLHQPAEILPAIDPAGWVTARNYNSRALDEMVVAWRAERAHSLEWLRGLVAPDLERPANHPSLAQYNVRAGDLLASWVAHDLLHLRQLIELRYAYLARVTTFDVRYAGDW